jgi:hypothetical protein
MKHSGEHENDVQPLRLNQDEVLFIDDMLSLMIGAPEDDGSTGNPFITVRPLTPRVGLPAPFRVIEKIMHAVLFTTDPDNVGKEAVLHLECPDLMMLREIACSSTKRGEEPVGYNLKRKIYGALYGETYKMDKVANRLLSQVSPSALELADREPLHINPSKPGEKQDPSRPDQA